MNSKIFSLLFIATIACVSITHAFIPLKVLGRLSMPVLMQHSLLRAARIGKLQEVGLPAIRIHSNHPASHVYPHVSHQQVSTHGAHVISEGHHGSHASIGHPALGSLHGGHHLPHRLNINTAPLSHLHDAGARELGLNLGLGSATGLGLNLAGLGGLGGGIGGGLGGGLVGGFDGGLAGNLIGGLGGGI